MMSEAVARIVAQLGALSQQERAELAHAVLLSLEPEEPGVEEAWDRELARRKANLMNNPGSGVPWEEVKRRIRSRHGR
jgi:putative addiction module component (TIGR02574 family)